MNRPFEFSEISTQLITPHKGHIGFVSFVLNKGFFCSGIAIHTRPFSDSIRLVYPVSKTPLGVQFPLFHPLNKETGDLITQEVFNELKKIEKKVNSNEYSNTCIK